MTGWDQFPDNVAHAMADYLDRFDQDRVEDLLRPLAHSYGDGLPPDELWAGLATGNTWPTTDSSWPTASRSATRSPGATTTAAA